MGEHVRDEECIQIMGLARCDIPEDHTDFGPKFWKEEEARWKHRRR
jgi:hypothetical protein